MADLRDVPCLTENGQPFDLEILEKIDFATSTNQMWIKDLQATAVHWCRRALKAEKELDNQVFDGGEY